MNRTFDLHRLNESSYERLAQVASDLACKVVEHLHPSFLGKTLPRGYRLCSLKSNVGSADYLAPPSGEGYLDASGGYLHGDFHTPTPKASPDDVRQFADDVADGWLDELATFVDSQKIADDVGVEVLSEALR